MSKSQKSEYTGTWIPAHIMEDARLSAVSKITYAIIASFRNGCFASNKWLAEKVGVSARTITTSVAMLEELGFVARAGESDSERVLLAIYDDPSKNFQGGAQNFLPPHAKISTNNKVDNKSEKASQKPQVGFDGQNVSPQAGEPQEPAPAVPTTNKLHYDVIKKYGLPISNHLHVKAKSKALDQEIGSETAQAYLQRLLDLDYRTVAGEFKPELFHSRDIYNKRIQITAFLDKNAPKTTMATSGKTALELANERYNDKDWGI